jgi:hypothetical protein
MRNTLLWLGAMLIGLGVFSTAGRADHPRFGPATTCEPTCAAPEETCAQAITRKVCRTVPDVQKITRWVYTCKPLDFCVPNCLPPGGLFHNGCESGCGDCGKVRTKCLLVKALVTVECPTTNCVVDGVTENAPCASPRRHHGGLSALLPLAAKPVATTAATAPSASNQQPRASRAAVSTTSKDDGPPAKFAR